MNICVDECEFNRCFDRLNFLAETFALVKSADPGYYTGAGALLQDIVNSLEELKEESAPQDAATS